jgi:F-type H+-transporting ATPase subunit epsilon
MANNFHLTIVTPDKTFFDGEASYVMVRSINGDVGILANHAKYVTPLAIGTMKVTAGGQSRFAAIAGGFLKAGGNQVMILTQACEWEDEIDVARAQQSADKAKERMERKQSQREYDLAEIKLKTALNRIDVANRKQD